MSSNDGPAGFPHIFGLFDAFQMQVHPGEKKIMKKTGNTDTARHNFKQITPIPVLFSIKSCPKICRADKPRVDVEERFRQRRRSAFPCSQQDALATAPEQNKNTTTVSKGFTRSPTCFEAILAFKSNNKIKLRQRRLQNVESQIMERV